MKLLKTSLIVLVSTGFVGLGACSSNQATNSSNNPAATNSTASSAPESRDETASSSHAAKPQVGGQVVESGPYHLEFVSQPEANSTHLDFYLQRGDNHTAISDANVTAQVQLPDGTQKTIPLSYDAEGKHYAAMLPGTASGQYQVKVISEINGQKVDGRFNFNR